MTKTYKILRNDGVDVIRYSFALLSDAKRAWKSLLADKDLQPFSYKIINETNGKTVYPKIKTH